MKQILKNYWFLLYAVTIIPFSNYFLFFISKYFSFSPDSLLFYFLYTFTAFIIMLLLPLGIIKYKYEDRIENYGFNFPEKTLEAVKITISIILLFGIILYFFSKNQSFRDYYALRHSITLWFFVEVIISFFYFISEEFFFRGFILYKLLNKLGNKALIVSNIFFALLHFGKPSIEIIFSFFFGLLLSIITLRTKSFFPSALIHFFVALILNLLIVFN